MKMRDGLLRSWTWLNGLAPLRRIALCAALGLAVSLGYALLATKWYLSTVTVMPSKSPKGPLAQIGNAAGEMLGGSLLGLAEDQDVDRIAAVLESRSVSDAVIQKFNLLERYEQQYIEFARKHLWKHCSVKVERQGGIVSLSCEDTDPEFAQKMLDFFAATANEAFKRVNQSRVSEQVRFLEKRVQQLRDSADESARALRDFEEKHKIVDLEEQGKAVVSALASLKSGELTRELQLDYLHGFSSADESTASQLRRQLDILGSKFQDLETPDRLRPPIRPERPGRSQPVDEMFPPAMAVPQLRFELEQLYRERKFRETALLLTMQRLEAARAEEAGEISSFQILDSPVVPTYKDRPKRLLIVALGVFLGALAGLAWIRGPKFLRAMTREILGE